MCEVTEFKIQSQINVLPTSGLLSHRLWGDKLRALPQISKEVVNKDFFILKI
jgi:hypothetical protein